MNRFLRMIFIFLIAYFALSFFLPNQNKKDELSAGDVGIKIMDATVAQGNLVRVLVQNNMETPLVLGEREYPPENLIVERKENGRWVQLHPESPKNTDEKTELQPGEKREFSFPEYNTELFFPIGEYRVAFRPGPDQEFEAGLEVYKPGFLRTLFRAIYKVIYNTFILLLMLGGHSLGLAILLITLIVKLLLWHMTQHSLESQQKMQKIQPELQHLREKYKNDQQKMAMETMALWKKYKISPFSAFTPLLIQFPILIALFYVIRDGLAPNNTFLLYPPFRDFDFSKINEVFLGIFNLSHHPLDDRTLIWLPFVIAGCQWWAMRLSFKRAKLKKEKEQKKKSDSEKTPGMMDQMETMNKTMTYILPLMIFSFTLTFPAGVGFYWWISTLIGIGQQYLVNKRVHK